MVASVESPFIYLFFSWESTDSLDKHYFTVRLDFLFFEKPQQASTRFVAKIGGLDQTGTLEMITESMNQVGRRILMPGHRILPVAAAALLLVGAIGCQSDKHAISGKFAAVLLSGNTPGQIRNAAVTVFLDNGYKVRQTDPNAMVFEKQGSRMNNFAYGNWVGDTPIWVRVKSSVVPVGDMRCRLECTAYLVRDIAGASEEELPVNSLHKGPYQKMLEEVAKRLSSASR